MATFRPFTLSNEPYKDVPSTRAIGTVGEESNVVQSQHDMIRRTT